MLEASGGSGGKACTSGKAPGAGEAGTKTTTTSAAQQSPELLSRALDLLAVLPLLRSCVAMHDRGVAYEKLPPRPPLLRGDAGYNGKEGGGAGSVVPHLSRVPTSLLTTVLVPAQRHGEALLGEDSALRGGDWATEPGGGGGLTGSANASFSSASVNLS